MARQSGMAGIAVVLLLASSVRANGLNLVSNPGFETPASTLGSSPSGYGYWQGDESAIVTARQGIVPYEGQRMLQFISAASLGASKYGASEVEQLLDVGAYTADIGTGLVVVTATAYFNRVRLDSETDSRFSLRMLAMAGDPAEYRGHGQEAELALAYAGLYTDTDRATWEPLTLEFAIPAATDYLTVEVAARENRFNDITGTEFDGHYADNVSVVLRVIPCLLYTSPSPRDRTRSRMPSSA